MNAATLSFWGRIVARWKELRRRRSILERRIQWDAEGVRVVACFRKGRTEVEWSLTWRDIRKAVAFKQDLVFRDCICVGLEDTSGSWQGMDEEMQGWEDVMKALPLHLPGSLDWESAWKGVAYPPFRENATVLFQR